MIKLTRFLCWFSYHRFGYDSDYCVRCGRKYDDIGGDGSITSNDYNKKPKKTK